MRMAVMMTIGAFKQSDRVTGIKTKDSGYRKSG